MAQKPRLFDLVRQKIQALHYSRSTEKTYIAWIRQYILFHHKRHPSKMGKNEINEFLTYLAVKRKVSASTQNQALCAIVFLYKQILNIDIGLLEGIIRAQRPIRLPVVLSKAEVIAVIKRLEGVTKIVGIILYGSGLRLMECLRLRVKDIDFSSNQIIVRDGKGNKDKITMLPELIKISLNEHLIQVRTIHNLDIKAGFGRVNMPYALSKKYPNSAKEWGWQYLFPNDIYSCSQQRHPGSFKSRGSSETESFFQ